ncbi:hypothetical protein RvY_00495 [Ramazzottius varieornatus]|uniref:Uncharacterized protein n=1 Tax=Ramazzottius varieornatus TaxID=947166 RepID=A0A1D1UJ93_RAMVA|nr:hypothetical protein RvY_00495 [Ramazzottius varieornatus]
MVFQNRSSWTWILLWSTLLLRNFQELCGAPSIGTPADEDSSFDLDKIAAASNRDCQGQEAVGGPGGDAEAGPGGNAHGGAGGKAKAGSNCVGIGGKGGTAIAGRPAGADKVGGEAYGGKGGDGHGGDYAVGIGGPGGDAIGELGYGGDGGDGYGGKCAKGYGGKGGRGSAGRGKDGMGHPGTMVGCKRAAGNRDATGNPGETVDKTVDMQLNARLEPGGGIADLGNVTLPAITNQTFKSAPKAVSQQPDDSSINTEDGNQKNVAGNTQSEGNVTSTESQKTAKQNVDVSLQNKTEERNERQKFLSTLDEHSLGTLPEPAKQQEETSVSLLPMTTTPSNLTVEAKLGVDGTSALTTSTKDRHEIFTTISGDGEVKISDESQKVQSATPNTETSTAVAVTTSVTTKTV